MRIQFFRMAVVVAWLAVPGARAAINSPSEAGQVGMLVSKLLEERHFNAKHVDSVMAREFLKNYLNALDYNHMFFHQNDVEGFQKRSSSMADDVVLGDMSMAFEIYRVYSNRVEQVCAMAKELAQEKYQFDEEESVTLDRHELSWPYGEKEQRQLIRQRVKSELLEERLNKEKPEEAVKIITRRYDRVLRSLHENDVGTITFIFLNALAALYDPHTQYMEPQVLESFNIDMRLSLSGIGAQLSSEDGYAKITGIVPGGPADLDKRLKVNDRICAVAQGDGPMAEVVDMKLSKVVQQIRGPKGTTVRLKIIPADAPDPSTRIEIAIVRDEIKLTEQEAKARIIEKVTDNGKLRLGYIELPQFYFDPEHPSTGKSSSRDVRRLIEKLNEEKIDGLIFDLRRNTGGSLPEAITLTGLFIDEGPVVQVKDARGKIAIGRDSQPGESFDGPMVVLTTHISASASEILAGALQDYGRAVIVGDHSTFGKGTVQQMMPLDAKKEFGDLKLTIQKFYRVSGGSTQFRGVVPDISLPSVLDVAKVGENNLTRPLPYDEVVPATFVPWSRRPPPVEELKRRSAQRVLKDVEFRYVAEDIERAKKHLEDKTVSLNEAQRLAERKENEARAEARKQEREARKVEPLKFTEITIGALDGQTNNVATINRQTFNPKAAEPKTPESDPYLDEGLNILTDYVQWLGGMALQN